MASVGSVGWDAQGYWKASQAVHHDSDPYAEDLVALNAFHTRLASNPAEHPPFVYVYSPMTLPLLRLLAVFPRWLLGLLYWAAIATGALLQLWAGFQMADQRERRWLALMLPAIIFFPGLVTDDAILSGNVAYPLYGAILAAATAGWKRGRWSWYYIAVLAASVFKTPFLVFLAFPVLIESGRDRDSDSDKNNDRGRRQWVPSAVAAIMGVLIFAAQIRLWPGLFREYLSSLRLVFDYLHDFGYGPAGALGKALWRRGLPSSLATTILHLVVVCALGIVLLFLARRVRERKLPREAWVPVALVGTALLNPRIMKYDLGAITIPMLLIGGRALRFALERSAGEHQAANSHCAGQERSFFDRTLILVASGCFLIPNVITVAGPSWFPVETLVLLAIFAMGVWSLDQSSQFPVRSSQFSAKPSSTVLQVFLRTEN
ncbi:MAG TPA: glycosyltransferase 87 family protein [Terriglobales bacterium]|nr:glycosyltransferase 87 family protein [Terriglobales bacterium]